MMARRSALWIGGMVVLVGLAGGAWLVGAAAQSPEQAAARASEPDPSWVTARVDYRVLSATVIQRGDVRAAASSLIGVPASVEGSPVVTQVVVEVGADVSEGARVVEVSGRPVFVLAGDVPVYRTLRPGMSGDDVSQLQAALSRLGFRTETDGVYGEATKEAVSEFYRQAGYEPIPASPTAQADIATAEEALADAETAVLVAQSALEAAAQGQPGSAIAQAEAARNDAQRALDSAVVSQTYDLTLKQEEIDGATAARDALAAATEIDQPELDAANHDLNRLLVEIDELRRSSQNAVDSARESLRVATLALDETRAKGDTRQAEVDLQAATAARDRARQTRDTVVATNGPTVPQGEIVFVPELPGRVLSAVSKLGPLDATGEQSSVESTSSDRLVELGVGGLVVTMNIRPDDVGLVRVGMTVDLLDESSGATYPATIQDVSSESVLGADDQIGYPATVAPTATLPDRLLGANLRVTITAASTGEKALVVPLAAVSSNADGTTRVSTVDGPNGTPVDVPVRAGLSADGFVVVTPIDPAQLAEGDLVVVGV